MTLQLTMFDGADLRTPLVRRSDPVTSRLGESHVAQKLSTMQERFLLVLAEHPAPMTACEVAIICADRWGDLAESYRKRANELKKAGRIRIAGQRKCGVTQNKAQVYIALEPTP